MSHTEMLLRDEAREKPLRGAHALTEAVRVTLGPRPECSPPRGGATSPRHFFDERAAGILGPARVVRLALENAVSVAGVLLLTGATLTGIEDAPGNRRPAGETMDRPNHGSHGNKESPR